MTRGYARSLGWLLRRRWIVMVVVWLVVAALGGVFFSLLRVGARADRGPRRDLRPPAGAAGLDGRLHLRQLRAVEQLLRTIPETAAYNAVAGFPTVDYGNAILRLKPWEQRTRKQQDIARELNAEVRDSCRA